MFHAHVLRPAMPNWSMEKSKDEAKTLHRGQDKQPELALIPTSTDCIDLPLARRFKMTATSAWIAVLSAGAVITLGWVIDCEMLKNPLAYGGKVHSSVAITFILSALALAATDRGRNDVPLKWLGHILSLIVMVSGALTLFENLSGLDLNLNNIWWQPRGDGPGIMFPGPMAPGVSACFILTGLSSLLFRVKTKHGFYPVHALSMATALISLVVILGHIFGASYLCTIAGCIKVPLAAALLFLALSYSKLLLAADAGLMSGFAKNNRAGTLIRRSSLFIACLPMPLWVMTAGERAGLYDQAFGWALFGLFALSLVVLFVVWTVKTLDDLDVIVARANREITTCKEVERLKQEFVAEVSHELRTPLTSLQATLTLLAKGVYGPLSGSGETRVKRAESGVSRLITLINNLLDIEKMEAGKLRMRYADVNLADVIERSISAVEGFAEQQGVTLTTERKSITVLADTDRIVQVLVNLLSNAVKFSKDGGEVQVSIAERVDCCELQVIDHGMGIPFGYEASIFEKYEQAHVADDKRWKGTGLGLPICKAIVEQHGGTIGVRATEGGGSTFWFSFPHADVRP